MSHVESPAEQPDQRALSRRTLLRGGVVVGAAALASACSGNSPAPVATGRPIPPKPSATTTTPSPAPTTTEAAAPPDPAEIKANELGLVPVMMYHRITPKINGEYDTTPADFRAQLRHLFGKGYRPVRTIDLVRGDLPVKAGYSPVVLTFDDGYSDQFAMDASGNVDPTTGVGILLDVCKEFPDCPPAGSFNINKNPFTLDTPAAQQAGLQKMHELGFEIANHTFNHDNLSHLDATGVQEDFVKLQRLVESAVPGASVLTMALPFGVEPHSKALAHRGSWQGVSYVNEGVLMVGANPSHSPFSPKFDPQQIPRIRSSSWNHGNDPMTGKYWIDWLDHNADLRYVAAGNPGHVTVPKSWAAKVAPAYRSKLVTY